MSWGSILLIFPMDNGEKDTDVHKLEVLRSQFRQLRGPSQEGGTKRKHQSSPTFLPPDAPCSFLPPKLQSFLTSPTPTITPKEGINYSQGLPGRLPGGGGDASGCQEDFKQHKARAAGRQDLGWLQSQQIPRLFPTSSHRDLSDGFRRTRVSRVSPRWCRLRWPVGELGAVSLGLGSVCGARLSWGQTLPPCVTPGSHKPLQDSASQES